MKPSQPQAPARVRVKEGRMEPVYVDERDAAEHRAPPSTGARWPWVVVAVALILTAITAFYYLRRPVDKPPELALPSTPPPSAPAPAAPAAPKYPLTAAPASSTQPLPTLADSDVALQETLRRLFGPAASELVIPHDVVRRVVVTVDNLPRRKLPQSLLPLRSPGGTLRASGGEREVIDAENSGRYTPYVWLVQRVDSSKLVSAYVELYPLFQEQYRELGYPKSYFNDRVIEAIDDLLATPKVDAPVALMRPRVLYEFADPELESLSAGQKIMLRIGSANADVVKAKLREVRAEILARSVH
jgi:hypothetical protein